MEVTDINIPRERTKGLQYAWNLVSTFAISDFRLKYHESILGYFWSMLNPISMFLVYYYVFTKIFPNPTQHYPLFLFSGIICYAFFQDCTYSAMSALSSKSVIMKKIYFPRSVAIFASSLTCIYSFLINFAILLVLTIVMKGFNPLILLLPIPILCLVLFSMGTGFLLATFFMFFRDMGQIWNVLVLIIFWVSPVVFNVEVLPASVSSVMYFNPLTRIFVMMRHYLLYNYFDLRFVVMTVVYSLLMFLVGYFVFRKYEHLIPELF